jgi:hypothetical protein
MTLSAEHDPHHGVKLTISINTIDAIDTAKLIFFSPACTLGTNEGGRIDFRSWSLFALSPAISALYLIVDVVSRNT